MLNAKGLYEYKLVDSDTDKVALEGQQWNLINDSMYASLCSQGTMLASDPNVAGYLQAYIQLSITTPTPGLDYRSIINVEGLTCDSSSPVQSFTIDTVTNSAYVGYNFTPPVSQKIWKVIGIGLKPRNRTEPSVSTYFASFIELSVPITQNTNQYLYVKYTLFLNVNLTNQTYTPNNRYISYHLNKSLLLGGASLLGTVPSYADNSGGWYNDNIYNGVKNALISQFLEPTTINNVARAINNNPLGSLSIYSYDPVVYPPISFYNDYVKYHKYDDIGSWFGLTLFYNFSTTDFYGPIGSVSLIGHLNPSDRSYSSIYQGYLANYTDLHVDGSVSATLGYSPIPNNVPSISRVFKHPASRISQIFSDPAYPANSLGTIVPTGTPTNKLALVGRVKITKTGDACDLVDETFTVPDHTNDQLLVAQDWTDASQSYKHIVRVSSTITLPSPLIAAHDYTVMYIDTTHIKLSDDGGLNPIDITDAGAGVHTISRQITGTYQYEDEMWTNTNPIPIPQLSMAIDGNNKVMPAVLYSPVSYAEGGSGGNPYESQYRVDAFYCTMIQQQFQYNGKIYTIQKSRVGNYLNVCSWLLNTIETSVALHSFTNYDANCGGLVVVGTMVYMAIYGNGTSNGGVYSWDLTNQGTAPAKMTITGIISDYTVKDLAYDSITGYLWAGHTTGLSRIDLNTLTATQYLNTTGQALDGLASSEVDIKPGQLCAHNGHVLRGGQWVLSISIGGAIGVESTVWLMKDGTGWYRLKVVTYPTCGSMGATIRKSTGQIVTRNYNRWEVTTVTVTGKGTGTAVIDANYSLACPASGTYYYYQTSQIIEVNDGYYAQLIPFYNDSNAYTYFGIEILSLTNGTSYNVARASSYGSADRGGFWIGGAYRDAIYDYFKYSYAFGCARNMISYNNTKAFMAYGYLYTSPIGNPTLYGWDGAQWSITSSGSKQITKSSVDSLLNGVSIQFNNATGQLYDKQFVSGDRLTFMYAPCIIKDNLQTYSVKVRSYFSKVVYVNNVPVTVPAIAPYTWVVPEKTTDPNFRDLDSVDMVTSVYEGATKYTKKDPVMYRTVNHYSNNILTIGAHSIQTGDLVSYWCNYYNNMQGPYTNRTYYAIRDSSSTIKLASTYAKAMAGTALDNITSRYTSIRIAWYQSPTVTQTYNCKPDGTFEFHSSDAGKNLTISYVYTVYS